MIVPSGRLGVRSPLSSELPQMVIYVEKGMAHSLGPRHLPEHGVRPKLPFEPAKAPKQGS